MRTLQMVVPMVLVAVALPLILRMIPPNRFYGFRTPKTLSSDEIWYPANFVAGIALTGAGLVWAGAALARPEVYAAVGLGSVALAALVAFLYLRSL